MDSGEIRSICTTPPGCHNGCGILVTVKDGRVISVRGDPSNPFNGGALCPRGPALPRTVYSPDRILRPMRKTPSGWKPVSWDSALAQVEERFLHALETAGPSSVLFCKGTGRDIGPWLSRLAYGFGSPEYYAFGPGSGSACLMPRMSITNAVFGGFMVADCSQYFPERYSAQQWRRPECILIWGSNPVDSNPDGFLGQWIVSCMRLGSRLVTVDPRRTWTARRSSYHLQLRPGTDGALAMAFLNVMFHEGLVDSGFVKRYVLGWEKVREQVQSFSPERAGAICGIPPETIREAALLYLNSSPSALQWGVSIDMSPSALGTAHALTALVVLSGNLDVPGGNVVVTDPYGISRRGADRNLSHAMKGRKTGAEEFPMTTSGYPYGHADTLLRQISDGREIKCAWYQGTGITDNGFAAPARTRDLLSRTGFSVAVDMYMSRAVDELCDLFLPVCSCLERKGIRNWWYQLAAFDRVIEPLGESRSDMEIVLETGKRIAPDHFPWNDVTGWFDSVLAPSGHTWKQLVRKGWLMPGPQYRKYKFNTPSGMIELQPEIMGRADLLPAPWFLPPPSEGRHPGFPLRLTTGARSSVFFHGEHRNIKELRAQEPLPLVEVHPDDLPGGTSPGDWVRISTPWGSCLRAVSEQPLVSPGVISAVHGWTGRELNINELLPEGLEGRGGLGYPFRCLPCCLTGPVRPPGGFPAAAHHSGSPERRVVTDWCTGCRACAVACEVSTGVTGIRIIVVNGEFTPEFTSSCLSCTDPPCAAVCHTGCLKEAEGV